MVLVSSREILQAAKRDGYAVGAFNTSNLEVTQAIVEAAVDKRSPVIVSTSPSAIKYAGISHIRDVIRSFADEASVPVALHLDHGLDVDTVVECIEHGWTSVMIDASRLPFAENVAMTRQVIDIAHDAGVSVEAELGRLVGIEDAVSVDGREASLTDPSEAATFVEETGCDVLAVAVGTSHGAYKFKGEPRLDFARLREIAQAIPIALALHGASGVARASLEKALQYGAGAKLAKGAGVPDEAIMEAIRLGIQKINIDTDLRLAFVGALREVLATQPDEIDLRKLLAPGRQAVKFVVSYKMELFGSSGRA
ncbi:MAG: class II fructose-1,6-bisphosphate aldolase [Chloroflexi bacterium]|nr:class II fructose-1,6-bisphosphate aldolase [Chloroflexota bacterium]